MSAPRYVVTVSLAVSGRYRWTVSTISYSDYPVYRLDPEYRFDAESVSGEERTFDKASRKAAEHVAAFVTRDILAELRDSFESNVPVASAGVA